MLNRESNLLASTVHSNTIITVLCLWMQPDWEVQTYWLNAPVTQWLKQRHRPRYRFPALNDQFLSLALNLSLCLFLSQTLLSNSFVSSCWAGGSPSPPFLCIMSFINLPLWAGGLLNRRADFTRLLNHFVTEAGWESADHPQPHLATPHVTLDWTMNQNIEWK